MNKEAYFPDPFEARKAWDMMSEEEKAMSREKGKEKVDNKLREAIIKNPDLVLDNMGESNSNKKLDKFYAQLMKESGIDDFYLTSSNMAYIRKKSRGLNVTEIRFWDSLPEIEGDVHFSDSGTGKKIADCLGNMGNVLEFFENDDEYNIETVYKKEFSGCSEEECKRGIVYHITKKTKEQ